MNDETALAPYGVGMTPTALTLPPDLSFEDWTGVGEFLFWSKAQKESELDTINWMLGDWLRFGERKWGERYAQAVTEMGLAYQTLANIQWTAGKFDSSRRREKLTFTHHAAVAALPEADADELLSEAEANKWSSYTIREHAQNRTAANDGKDPVAERARRALARAADLVARLDDEDWADAVVDGLVRPLCRDGDAAAFLADLALRLSGVIQE